MTWIRCTDCGAAGHTATPDRRDCRRSFRAVIAIAQFRLTMAEAAKMFGVNAGTIAEELRRYPDVRVIAIDRAREVREQNLLKRMKLRDGTEQRRLLMTVNREQFIEVWEAANSPAEVAEWFDISVSKACRTASWIRRSGTPLKKFQRGRAARSDAKSTMAARVCHDEGITLGDAAARHGVSRQAVQQAYARTYAGHPQPSSRPRGNHAARELAVELARSGKPLMEIADETKISLSHLYQVVKNAGVVLPPRPTKTDAIVRAVEAVRDGASCVDAAIDHGLSYNTLAVACRRAGIELNAHKVPNGRAVRAADLVESEGLSIAEAARRTRCSPPSVSAVLRRRRQVTTSTSKC